MHPILRTHPYANNDFEIAWSQSTSATLVLVIDRSVAMGQCYSHLNIVEREEISCGLARDELLRAIARRLGRSASSISREIGRNAG
jgi:hypothetical protein